MSTEDIKGMVDTIVNGSKEHNKGTMNLKYCSETFLSEIIQKSIIPSELIYLFKLQDEINLLCNESIETTNKLLDIYNSINNKNLLNHNIYSYAMRIQEIFKEAKNKCIIIHDFYSPKK
jgi:hypothetical protein